MRLLTVIAVASTTATAFAQAPMTNGMTPTGFTTHEAAPAELVDVYESYQANFGFVPNLAKVMAGSPALMRSYVDTQNHLKEAGKLSQAEINVVQMAIAVENKCEYCTAGHTMAGKAFFKTPMEDMQAVRNRKALDEPRLNALRNFAILVYMKRGEVDSSDFEKFVAAGYTRDQALDVVACVAAKVMSNYTNSLAKTPLDPPLEPLAAGLPFAAR
ncbi:MAG: carboxymuconolactone decarboxylase family protein [Planctomycetota bacterium]